MCADEGRIPPERLTLLLNQLGEGDAARELWPVVYDELKKLARTHASGVREADELEPTVLVHEAWLKLVDTEASFECRAQFFAFASRVMRSVLVDDARVRATEKRGEKLERITLDEDLVGMGHTVDFPALDDALTRLERMDPDLAHLVELRFFGGLKQEEIAQLLATSLRSVQRDWRLARSWLRGELGK